MGRELDIKQFGFSIIQDDNRGYFRHREYQSEVRMMIRDRDSEWECCSVLSRGFGGDLDIGQLRFSSISDDGREYFRHGEH